MEVACAREIFHRSLTQYGGRYKTCFGDSDSKAYMSVVEDNPYRNDFTIEKMEWVGHTQKRMGTRLRTLRAKLNKKQLSRCE